VSHLLPFFGPWPGQAPLTFTSLPGCKHRNELIPRFGKEFTTAVEQKQIAQQDAERAKFVVEKAEQERQAAVIRAEGEAEAANTISKALNRAGDAFVQFRKIEAAREIGMFPPLYYLLNSSFVSSSFSIHLLTCLDHAFIKTCLSPHLHFYHD